MADLNPDDPVPALPAEIDQAVATSPLLAGYARGLFNAFKGEGFTDSAALYLAAVHMKDSPGRAP